MRKLLEEINVLLEKDIDKNLKGMLIAVKEEIEIEDKCESLYDENKIKARELANTIKNVQLGCGKHLLENYINIDIVDGADIIWDIRKDLPFEDNSIKKIFSEHVLEHMDYPKSANTFIEESYRVLESGGEFIVGIPDIALPLEDIKNNSEDNMKIAKEEWYCNRDDILDSMNSSIDYLNYVMRDQLFHEKYHPHYWGYTKENLMHLLEKYGFKNIEVWEPDLNIINQKRLWGTLYLRAVK